MTATEVAGIQSCDAIPTEVLLGLKLGETRSHLRICGVKYHTVLAKTHLLIVATRAIVPLSSGYGLSLIHLLLYNIVIVELFCYVSMDCRQSMLSSLIVTAHAGYVTRLMD